MEEAPEVSSKAEDEEREESPQKRRKMPACPIAKLIVDLAYKVVAKAVKREHAKKVIVFKRLEKKRQQKISKEKAAVANVAQKEAARKSRAAEHYTLHGP